MNCERAQDYLPLYLYGELSFEEENALETHLASCGDCRTALEAERKLHAAFDAADEPLPAGLLTACREGLDQRLVTEEPAGARAGWWRRFQDTMAGLFAQTWLRPVGAMALLAIGFLGGRVFTDSSANAAGRPMFETPTAEPLAVRVSRVDRDDTGKFQVVVDETRRRVVAGTPNDEQIRRLLITAAADSADPGLRGESMEYLASVPPCDETRQALLTALEQDPNDGVRLRALQGLRPLARQGDVRRVLARVLVKDSNAGVRTQAIDLLTQGNLVRESEIIGVFQDLMTREPNDYIRMRVQRQLQQAKASTEVY